jgi:hypothetical protein
MKRTSSILYSVLAGLIVLEFLLTSWSISGREVLLSNDLLRQDLSVRISILIVCVLCLVQIYFLHVKGTRLTAFSYWFFVMLYSASTMYLKYVQDFLDQSHLLFSQVLFSVSFLTWTMLLALGVLFESFCQSRKDEHEFVHAHERRAI